MQAKNLFKKLDYPKKENQEFNGQFTEIKKEI